MRYSTALAIFSRTRILGSRSLVAKHWTSAATRDCHQFSLLAIKAAQHASDNTTSEDIAAAPDRVSGASQGTRARGIVAIPRSICEQQDACEKQYANGCLELQDLRSLAGNSGWQAVDRDGSGIDRSGYARDPASPDSDLVASDCNSRTVSLTSLPSTGLKRMPASDGHALR